MALLQNTAEGQADGTALIAANSGGTSGDAFATVNVSGAGAITFSTTNSAHGTRSYHITGTTGDVASIATPSSTGSSYSVRFYLFLTSTPASVNFLSLLVSGTTEATIGISGTTKLQVKDATGTTISTFANALSLSTWYRIELQVTKGTGTTDGTYNLQYYAGDSTTAIATYSSTTLNMGTSDYTTVIFGKSGSATGFMDVYVDDIAWYAGSAAPIGPASGGGGGGGGGTVYENTAEGQSAGTALTQANSGGASGTAFGSVTTSGAGAITFYSTSVAHGTKAYHITGNTNDVAKIDTSVISGSSYAIRFYMYLVSTPASLNLFNVLVSGAMAATIGISGTTKIQVKDATNTTISTFTNALSLSTWYRVEMQVTKGTTTSNGVIGVQYFAGDSTTAIGTYTSSTFNTGTSDYTNVNFGKTAIQTAGLDIVMDNIAWSPGSSTAIGPASTTNIPPTANAGTNQQNIEPYTIVTLSGTDNDSDGTVVTRTWTQVSGSPAVTITGTGATRTYVAPGTINGTTLTFGYQVTDDQGASSTQSTTSHTIYPVTERAVMGGVEVPVKTVVAKSGGLA